MCTSSSSKRKRDKDIDEEGEPASYTDRREAKRPQVSFWGDFLLPVVPAAVERS